MSDKNDTVIPEQYKGSKVSSHEVTLFDSHVEVKMPNGMNKAISLGDFVTILAKTMNEETAINTMLMPAGCYVIGQTLTEMKLSCYYPGKVREVEFIYKDGSGNKPKKFKIPFPNTIISHKLNKVTDHWMHTDSKYFATSKSVTELGNNFIWERDYAKQIWVLPLGNIYPEAKLCQGTNVIPKGPYKDNLRGLDWHFAVLYNSSFNNDLHIPSVRNGYRCEDWFAIISEHKVFPYELLIEGKKVVTTRMSTGQELNADNVASVDWLGAAIR
jgi:hypothetical protein